MPKASTSGLPPTPISQPGLRLPLHPFFIDTLGIYHLPGHVFAPHLPTVHTRKVSLIHTACLEVEQWRDLGLGVEQSCQVVARRYSGVHLGVGRRLKLGEWALVRRYYRWVKGGRTATAFPYRYGWDKGLPKPRKSKGRKKQITRRK